MKIENKTRFIRDVEYFGIDRMVAEKYIETLKAHISYVLEAGHKIGVPETLLDIHDDSKWFQAEFVGYALHFQGGGAPNEFSKAWLHHIHHNPHHWQHWIISDGYSPKDSNVEDGTVEMPYEYVMEMVADWMGDSRAYTNSGDMSEWLSKNIPRIKVHSLTAQYLGEILSSLEYEAILREVNFGNNKPR